MDLIDRKALYKEICHAYEYEYPTASGAFDEFVSKTLKNIIYNAPTVEAEKVVRCKDCERESYCGCTQYQGENGYCSLGERRGD